MTVPDPEKFREHYSEGALRGKLVALPLRAGRDLVAQVLTLYALLTDPNTPASAKVLAVGALGYFILPLDVIPDAVPFVGYLDDAAVMALVLDRLGKLVTPAVRARAEALLPQRFRV